LAEILQQLRFRYGLGFKPEALDGKRHKLRVKLADAVKNQHKGLSNAAGEVDSCTTF
jgi:hypothetical protein